MTPEQKGYIEGLEAAAKHILELTPDDKRPDGAAIFALQIQLLANQKRAEFVARGSGKVPKVYILSSFNEYGAENVRATLDKNKLPELLSSYSHIFGEMSEEQAALIAVDLDAVSRDGVDLSKGYGGIQLHIIEMQ